MNHQGTKDTKRKDFVPFESLWLFLFVPMIVFEYHPRYENSRRAAIGQMDSIFSPRQA
jgi:hypothetical protein